MLWVARSQLKAQGKKARFFHTLCTCGADASWAERGYLIGVRRPFAVEHCLRIRLRALTACRVTWRNSMSAKDLRAWDAITAEGSSSRRRSDARLRSGCRGRSRPTMSPGPSLDRPRQTDPCEHRIDGDARREVRDERLGAEAGSGGDAGKPPTNRFDFLWSSLLTLSIAKLDPDAGHASLLIQRAQGSAEPRPELGSALLVTVCRSRCDR